ncbi:hypothetical protein BDR26DRAFT_891518 [Obelidium mucronatum]|nr:hypothetical protein BDR26DRAFT_891518 [Obelidium mucronatum]
MAHPDQQHLLLRQILQRIPGLLIILLLPFVMLAPYHAPILFATYYGWLTAVFMFTALRTTLGVANTWICSVWYSKIDWIQKREAEVTSLLKAEPNMDLPAEEFMTIKDIFHVIIIPNYKESLETLVETLDVLASHGIAKTNYKVCLAMEAGETGCEDKAALLLERYSNQFHTLNYTVHPKDIPGEARGKSSNTNWACIEMYKKIANPPRVSVMDQKNPPTDPQVLKHVFTCMDADTCFAADYFLAVAYQYTAMSSHSRKAVIFMPTLLFDRNSDQVSFFVRLMDLAWSSAQMAFFLPKYPFIPATSAYSVPMELARAVGFWDTTWEAVGEDLHMTLKCYFATGGRLRLIPIYSPASCFNVCGDTPSFYSGLKARLTQLRRHSWAMLAFAYTLRQCILCLFGRGATLPKTYFQDPHNGTESVYSHLRQFFSPFFLLYSMMEVFIWSIHLFFVGFLTGFFVPDTVVSLPFNAPAAHAYWKFVTGSQDPPPVDSSIIYSIKVSSYLTIVLISTMALTFVLQEGYYRWSTIGRWELNNPSPTPGAAGDMHPVLGKRPATISKRREWWRAVELVFIPLIAVVNVLGLMTASFGQLWTDRLDYKVAGKPVSDKSPIALTVEVTSAK